MASSSAVHFPAKKNTKAAIQKEKRARNNQETSEEEHQFALLCQCATEEKVVLFRETKSSEDPVVYLQCSLCPQYFRKDMLAEFRSHILQHFMGDPVSGISCPFDAIGCRFVAVDKKQFLEHRNSHTLERPEVIDGLRTATPFAKLILQFDGSSPNLVVDLKADDDTL